MPEVSKEAEQDLCHGRPGVFRLEVEDTGEHGIILNWCRGVILEELPDDQVRVQNPSTGATLIVSLQATDNDRCWRTLREAVESALREQILLTAEEVKARNWPAVERHFRAIIILVLEHADLLRATYRAGETWQYG